MPGLCLFDSIQHLSSQVFVVLCTEATKALVCSHLERRMTGAEVRVHWNTQPAVTCQSQKTHSSREWRDRLKVHLYLDVAPKCFKTMNSLRSANPANNELKHLLEQACHRSLTLLQERAQLLLSYRSFKHILKTNLVKMFKDKGIRRTQCDVMWPEYLWVHAFHAAFYTLRMEYQARKKIFNKQKLVQRHFFH